MCISWVPDYIRLSKLGHIKFSSFKIISKSTLLHIELNKSKEKSTEKYVST